MALKSKQLKSEIVDIEATIAEAKRNLVIAKTDNRQLTEELAGLKDYSEDIKLLHDKEKLESDINTNSMYLTEEHADLTLLNEEAANLESGLCSFRDSVGYKDSVSFDDVLEGQKERYNTYINQRTEIVNQINKFQSYEKLQLKLQTAETNIENTKTSLNELFSKKVISVVTTEELDNLKTQLGELKFEAEQIEKWRNKLVDLVDKKIPEATCPVCQTTAHEGYLQDLPEFDTLVSNKLCIYATKLFICSRKVTIDINFI